MTEPATPLPARFALDAQGALRDPNERAQQLLGLADAPASLLALCPEEQPDGRASGPAWKVREAAALAGLAQSFPWQFRRRDGTPVDALVELERDGERLDVRLRDLTSLRSAERALRESQARLQQIVDHTSAAVFLKGLDGRYLWVNREFARIAGRPAEAIAGRRDDEVFTPDAAQKFRVHDTRVLEARQPVDTEERFVVDGRERIYLKHKFPLLAADGQPQAICGISTDITARKRVEEALRAAALAVSSAEGDDVFHELVRYLATILEVDVAFIAEFADESGARLRMHAAILDGHFLRQFEYPVEGSPCAQVVGRAFRFVASGVRREFPPGTIFEAKGMDSYAALPLVDSAGRQLGIVAVMNRSPMGDRELAESMLKIFAARGAAEIERRRSVDALAESEASYRSIFEASADAIFVHDWDTGRIVDVSKAAEAFYGWSTEELKHLAVEDISAADEGYTQERALAQLERARAGENLRFEWRVRHRSGTKAWHEVRIKPAIIGRKKRLLAYTRDISAAKAAEEALRASEEQYRAIFNASEDALVLWNSRFERVDVNPAFEHIFGFTRDEVLAGLAFRDLPDDEVEHRRDLVRRSLAGETCQVEMEALRRNGERFRVEIRTIPILHRGEPHVLAVSRDITERARAEAAVRASEEQYRVIFNASVDGMLVKDAEHRIVDVNRAFLDMHGYRRDEVVDRPISDFIPGDLREQCEVLLPRVLAGEPCHFEGQTYRRDRALLDVEIHGVPIRHLGRPHALVIFRDIGERKQHEEALRASEEQYRAIFNASADALMLWNSRLQRVDVNPAHERIFGFAREDVVGRGFEGLPYPEELAQPRLEMVRRALAGEPSRAELEALRKDGTTVVTELRTVPFQHRGQPHVLQIARDITERKRAEAAVRASEQRYRLLFEMESDAILVTDASTLDLLDANRAAVELWGYTRDELLRMKATDLSAEPEATRAALQGEAGTIAVPRRVHRKKDGTLFPVEITLNRFELDGRRIVLSAIRDVTERRDREEALRASEAQYRAIFNASEDALVLWNSRVEHVDVNAAHERMFGYAREETIGKRGLPGLSEEEAELRRAYVRRALAGERCRVELESVRRTGERFPIEVRLLPIEHRGEPHVLAIVRDLSERKAAEARRAELEAQLRQAQKMEALGHLTGGIAHDFNNLLTGILGYIALAEERDAAAEDERLGHYLDQARASCGRARDLIQQMLTFSRGRRGERRALWLGRLVTDSVKLLRASFPASVAIETDVEDDLPAVLVDPVQLEQVLINLAINARDAMDGAGRIRVVVRAASVEGAECASCRAAAAGRFVELGVADDGPGIAPGVRERMFEPFYSTKPVGRGSGMGLAMVHGIVHDHGGHVLVSNAPEGGARFAVLLPALEREAEPVPARRAADRVPRTTLRGRVLVVEDEEGVAAFMRDLLESWSLEVTIATDPAVALDRFARDPSRFDAVITDQTMPGMTGLTLAARLAALKPGMPILLYTGYGEGITPAMLAQAGVTRLLAKPLEPVIAYTALASVLEAAR